MEDSRSFQIIRNGIEQMRAEGLGDSDIANNLSFAAAVLGRHMTQDDEEYAALPANWDAKTRAFPFIDEAIERLRDENFDDSGIAKELSYIAAVLAGRRWEREDAEAVE